MSELPKILLLTTLGCRLNQTDTALLMGQLAPLGFIAKERLAVGEVADIVIVNTCAVTASASQKSRQATRKIRRTHPNAYLIVTGCSVNAESASWLKEEGIDLLLPTSERGKLRSILENRPIPEIKSFDNVFFENAQSVFPFKSRAYLKVQDGCNNFCSYCIVPYARGRERSRDFEEIMNDFKNMLANGHKEIVIVGVNTCQYEYKGHRLAWLLRALLSYEGDFRIRLSSAEPHDDIPEIVDLMNEFKDKFCHFLHLPAQHLSNAVLSKMNRKYDFQTYQKMVEIARQKVPDIHIGTDLIIGFPTETDEDFELLKTRAYQLQFANSHLFTYSPREGTLAAKIQSQISGRTLQLRRNELEVITQKSSQAFALAQVGKQTKVLVEKISKEGYAQGWTDHYIRVKFPKLPMTKKGELQLITLDESYFDITPEDDNKR